MRFFDLVAMREEGLLDLADRLGYKRICSVGKDVELVGGLDFSKGKKIVRSEKWEITAKALRHGQVIGLLPNNYSVSKKLLETIKNEEKVLFLPLSPVVCSESEKRSFVLSRARSLARNALLAGVGISLVSLAESREGMLSSMQMLELANFIGIEQGRAKPMLCLLGGLL